MIEAFVRNFGLRLSADVRNALDRQGLTVYQAVTIASLVEREAVQDEEKPLIASVFLNRLKIGMKLDSDPTVQYALGYDPVAGTWWRNPLSLVDLQFNSPYNTYLYAGLPPAPIANPSLSALHAVAFPAETVYYFFRAKCDGSRLHEFAETFEEHLENACQVMHHIHFDLFDHLSIYSMHITILALGSLGDIQPCATLGSALKAAGHQVRFITFESFNSLIAEHELDFHPIHGNAQALVADGGADMPGLMRSFGSLAEGYARDLSDPHLGETDLIVNQLPLGLYGFDLAEKYRRPNGPGRSHSARTDASLSGYGLSQNTFAGL